jgi:hypothetical protein
MDSRGLHVLNLIWFGWIARLSQWVGGGGNFLVHVISACFPRVEEGGGLAPCDIDSTIKTYAYAPLSHLSRNTLSTICKRLRSPGIDSKESIPTVYEAWRAGTSNRLGIDSWAP